MFSKVIQMLFFVSLSTKGDNIGRNEQTRISDVAYMVGFTDPKYFSKRFKEYFGGSPSEYVGKK